MASAGRCTWLWDLNWAWMYGKLDGFALFAAPLPRDPRRAPWTGHFSTRLTGVTSACVMNS
jgi:hypothetical protein